MPIDALDDAFPRCPLDATPLEPVGEAEDASDARWWCPTCGRESIAE